MSTATSLAWVCCQTNLQKNRPSLSKLPSLAFDLLQSICGASEISLQLAESGIEHNSKPPKRGGGGRVHRINRSGGAAMAAVVWLGTLLLLKFIDYRFTGLVGTHIKP